LIRQICLVLLEYCSFSKVVLQYQYQNFSIVLQYKTARLVHPWFLLHCTCTADWRKHGFSIVNKSQKMLEDDGNGLATQ
jgi:hypothetical protein